MAAPRGLVPVKKEVSAVAGVVETSKPRMLLLELMGNTMFPWATMSMAWPPNVSTRQGLAGDDVPPQEPGAMVNLRVKPLGPLFSDVEPTKIRSPWPVTQTAWLSGVAT